MKFNNLKNSLLFKVACFILIFSMFPWEFLTPRKVEASNIGGHDAYFIETLLNSSGGYEVQVVPDSNKFGDGEEQKEYKNKHETEKYIDWSVYSNKNAVDSGKTLTADSNKRSLDDNTGLIFSFPSYQRGTTGIASNYTIDYNRAIKVADTLSSSLNNLMSTIKNVIDYKSLSTKSSVEDVSNSIAIIDKINAASGSSEGNWVVVDFGTVTIYYANPGTYSYEGSEVIDDTSEAVMIDKDGNLMAYVVESGKESGLNKTSQGFVWAMPKGYLWPDSGDAIKKSDEQNIYWGVANDKQANGKDARWITIFSLAEYANAQAKYHNYTLGTASYEDQSFIEVTIYNFVLGIYSGLLNALKLNTIPELLYNGGTRGGSAYEAGMMNSSWWNTVLKYHLIFQIMAWMMLIFAIAKILLQVNFSTINPQLTISIMDTLQKIFTVGFALALCIPFIKAMAALNNYIVNIFQTQAQTDNENLAAIGFAGIIILFGYLGITFTLNCIYIMRAIMIAILTASAPLFITSMAFAGPKQKGLFDNWFKEISANIFMQSVHAFAFAFLFDVMDNSSMMVTLVIYFSLLPIVDMFRQLIFGNAGGFAVSQGAKAAQTTGEFLKDKVGGTVKGAGNLALGYAGKKLNADIKTTDAAGSEGTSGEGKASEAGSRLNSNAASVGNKLKEKASEIDTSTKSGKAKALALKAGGSMLNGGSKMADYMKSTGGIMGNAVTRANLGDVQGSINASKTYGEGRATGTERAGHDIAEGFSNGRINSTNKKMEAERADLSSAEKDFYNAVENESSAKKYKDDEALGMAKHNQADAIKKYETASTNISNLQTKLNKKIANKGGSISSDGRGNNNVTLSSSQVSFDGNGIGYGNLNENTAQAAFGDDSDNYKITDKNSPYYGLYKLGDKYSKSNKGNNIRFNVKMNDNFKKQYDYDIEAERDKAKHSSPTTLTSEKTYQNLEENNK